MTLRFCVLGDSIAFGQGATRPEDTIGRRLSRALVEAGHPNALNVVAQPRARSDALAGQVRLAIEWRADLALVIIGANDLTHFVPVPRAATQLGNAVRQLRRGGVEVIVVPAPDMSVVPWVPPQMREVVSGISAELRRAQTRIATDEGAGVVDLHIEGPGADFAGDLDLFSADRFHPSSKGYANIAAALVPAAIAAAAGIAARRPT